MIGQNFPIRFSAELCCGNYTGTCTQQTPLPHTAIAADSLDIEPVENISYTWLASGERFDVELGKVL